MCFVCHLLIIALMAWSASARHTLTEEKNLTASALRTKWRQTRHDIDASTSCRLKSWPQDIEFEIVVTVTGAFRNFRCTYFCKQLKKSLKALIKSLSFLNLALTRWRNKRRKEFLLLQIRWSETNKKLENSLEWIFEDVDMIGDKALLLFWFHWSKLLTKK